MTTTILTICVNYNNEAETATFVRALLDQRGEFSQRIAVVDNSERPQQGHDLHSLVDGASPVRLYTPGRNLGYYGAAALGFEQDAREHSRADWTIVSNTDIEFPQADFLDRLCRLHPDNADAVVAPAIFSTISLGDQNPYMRRRPTAARMHWYKWVFRHRSTFIGYEALSAVKQRLLAWGRRVPATGNPESDGAPEVIYAPHGSFVCFHRRYFEAGGSLRHGAFLFGEEISVAEYARRLGLRVVYDPRLRVVHREHAATGILKARRKAQYVREASAYCADQFFR